MLNLKVLHSNMYNKNIQLPEEQNFTVLKTINIKPFVKKSIKCILITFIVLPLIMIFVKWQQTSFGMGTVIVFNPNHRPQNITALVSGRINKWLIHEGMLVKKNQKLVEIIDNDLQILENLRMQQTNIKMQYEASKNAMQTAELNLNRQKVLFEKGIASRKDYEKSLIEYNNYQAKTSMEQAKLSDINIKISRQNTQTIYAPEDGQIVSVNSGGLSTGVKAGETVATFLPQSHDFHDFAIELTIDPNDMPLIEIGNHVRIQFEGWPIVQLSGWPSIAIGTFGGVVKVIDGYLKNGKLRVIIVPDPQSKHPWPSPQFLRSGVNVKAWILLRRVSVGYEIWRKLNKFPKNREKSTDKKETLSYFVQENLEDIK